jgi:hypothetical protein
MTPIEEINAAAKLIRHRGAAMRAEMESPGLYWQTTPGGDLDAKYRAVNRGLGGVAGGMAAPWDLSANEAAAAWLGSFEDRMSELDFAAAGWNAALTIARAYLNDKEKQDA